MQSWLGAISFSKISDIIIQTRGKIVKKARRVRMTQGGKSNSLVFLLQSNSNTWVLLDWASTLS